jgi:hypothetical protein
MYTIYFQDNLCTCKQLKRNAKLGCKKASKIVITKNKHDRMWAARLPGVEARSRAIL